MMNAFIAELEQEAATTRRVLERVPEDRLSWAPHPKSMMLGQLAYHVAVLPEAIAGLLSELTVEAPDVPLPEAKSVEEILATHDRSVAAAREALAGWGEDGLRQEWQLVQGGRTLIAAPRNVMVRSLMMSHIYHHRGQLTVYLRLLDVPVPSVYGPSADEMAIA